jgi:hypothetical protein
MKAAMQIRFTLTAEEYAEAQQYWQRRLAPRWTRMGSGFVFWVIGIIFILCGVLLLIASVWFGAILCIAYGLFLVAWRLFLREFRFQREFRRSKTLQGEMTMDITEEGLWTSSSYGEGAAKWDTFSRYLETPHLFLLSVPPRLFYLIPKRAFVPGELDAVRQLLEEKISPQSRNQHRSKAAK